MFPRGSCVLISLLLFALILNGRPEERAKGSEKGSAGSGFESLAPQSLIGPGVPVGRNTSSGQVKPQASTTNQGNVEIPSGKDGVVLDDCLRDSRTMAGVLHSLQRLSDRLTSAQTLGQEQTRRLEALDYRLTRLEVQEQERAESLRTLVADTARSTQQLAWQTGQIASTLETLRQGQDEHRHSLSVLASQQPGFKETKVSVKGGGEILQKLQSLTNAVHGTKVAISSLTEQTTTATKNLAALANLTWSLKSDQSNLLTRQAFASSFIELKNNPNPHYVFTQQKPQGKAQAESTLPSDCGAIKKEGLFKKSGIYRIQPNANVRPFFVFCELSDRGGGWTVIQSRYEGAVNFYRDWLDYKFGFGNIGGEFWLGLEKIHILTNDKVNELVVELQDFTNKKVYAKYSAFAVGSEVEGYPLSFLAGYDGDAGDSLSYHAGMKFSTRDSDNDQWQDGSCAETHSGAWWYNGCDTSNLNGLYLNGEVPEIHEYKGMYWYDWHGPTYSLMASKLMIRPRMESVEGLGANRTSATKKPFRPAEESAGH